ncbi:polyprotein, partial [gruhelivirus A1]
MLSRLVGQVEKVIGLQDPSTEMVRLIPDRLTVGGAQNFTTVDQSSVNVSKTGQTLSEVLRSAVDVTGNIEDVAERFYVIWNGTWHGTDALFHQITELDVLQLLHVNELAFSGLANYHRYIRCGVEVIVQINPTNYQQGGLVAYLVPATQAESSVNACLSFPHGILNCMHNNMVRISAPWIYTRGYYDLKNPLYPLWKLVIRVWSPLNTVSGTANCSINVLARATEVELHGLHPLTNALVPEVRVTSTSNCVNLANRVDSSAKLSLALGQETFLPDHSVGSKMEVKDFTTWTSTPGLIHSFAFNASAGVGTVLASIPVNPYWVKQDYNVDTQAQHACTPLSSVAQQFCYWRGDMVYDIECFPTTFHSGRMLVAFIPGNETTDVSRLTLTQASSACCGVFDIRGTASTFTFVVPWCSDCPYKMNTYTTHSSEIEVARHGKSSSTGKLVIMVYNVLTRPGQAQTHVWCNVLHRARNLELYVPIYSVVPLEAQGEKEQESAGGFTSAEVVEPINNQGAGEAQQGPTGAANALEDPLLENRTPGTFWQLPPGKKRHSVNHMKLTNFLGRGQYHCTFEFRRGATAPDSDSYTIVLDYRYQSRPPNGLPGVLRWFCSMVQLIRGSLNLTMVINGNHDADLACYFTPAGLVTEKPWTEETTVIANTYRASLGLIRFNTRDVRNLQLEIPFYTHCHALTPNIGAHGDDTRYQDTCLGFFTVSVTNYNYTDENLRIQIYLSFGEDCQFFCPRAPMSNYHMLVDTDHVRRMQTECVESSVDPLDEEDEEKIRDNLRRAKVVGFERGKSPYKSLRMDVGKKRLDYAFAELQSHSEVEEELWTNGSVEDLAIVEKFEGGMRLQGFIFTEHVFSAKTTGPVGLPIVKNLQFTVEKYEDSWKDTGKKLPQIIGSVWVSHNVSKLSVNYAEFVEKGFPSHIRNLIKELSVEQMETLARVLTPCKVHMIDKVMNETEIGVKVKETTENVMDMMTEARDFMNQIKSCLQTFVGAMPSKIVTNIVRVVMSVLKWSLNLVACVKTNWHPAVVISTVIGGCCDTINCGMDIGSMMAQCIREVTNQEVKTQSLDIRSIAAGITVAKGLREVVMFVVKQIREFLEKDGKQQRIDAVLEGRERIQALLDACDAYSVVLNDDVNKVEHYDEGIYILKCLNTVNVMISGMPELSDLKSLVRDARIQVMNKMKMLGKVEDRYIVRPEPTVAYLFGDRGSGKTLLSMFLAARLSKALGVDVKDALYTRSFGSEYWDNYNGQPIVAIDDMGQLSDDTEWVGFCQLVSSAPFALNMADLSEKGRTFKSPIVICTSNISDPDPSTVYCSEAVTRRLQFKVKVEVRDYYKTTQGVTGVLDIDKARADGSAQDLSCLRLTMGNQEITPSELVDMILVSVGHKQQVMDDLMQIWSQSTTNPFDFIKYREVVKNTVVNSLYKNWRVYVGVGVAALTAILGGVGLYCATRKLFKEETNAAYTTDPIKRVVKLGDPCMTQSVLEEANLVHGNLVRFGIGKEDGVVSWHVNALGVCENYLLVPYHAFKFDSDYNCFYFFRKNVCYCAKVCDVEMFELGVGYNDLVLMCVPGMPKFKDIRHHFIEREQLKHCDGKNGTLATLNCGVFQLIAEGPLDYLEHASYKHPGKDGKPIEITIGACWRGHGDSLPGTCGGAVITSSTKCGNKIVGIHVAGGRNTLISKTVTREDIESLLQSEIHAHRTRRVEFITECVPLNARSSFEKTVFHKYFDETEINHPSVMPFSRKFDQDVMSLMLQKFTRVNQMEPSDFDDVVEHQVAILSPIAQTQGFLSIRESILGIPGMDGIDPVTSAGLPYTLRGLSKKDLVDFEEGTVCDEVFDRVCSHHSYAANGVPLDVDFQICAKDELRPQHKVMSGDTRLIECSPIDLTIFLRMCWGKVVSKLQSNPGWKTGIAVGIDPETQWHALWMSALRFGDQCVDLDYKNFDCSLHAYIIMAAVRVLCRLAGLSDDYCRAIAGTLAFSRNVVRNVRIWTNGGLPSGTPCTSLLNSISNLLILRYVLKKTYPALSFVDLDQCFRLLTYGDDVVIVVNKNQAVDDRLPKALSNWLCLMGFQVTGADKGPVQLRPITEVQFLKRGLRFEQGVIHAVMSPKTIRSMLAYKRNNARLVDNIRVAAGFMYHHGQDVYRQWRFWMLSL